MKKRFLATFLAAGMVLGVVGCGSSSSSTTSDSASDSTEQATDAAEEESAEEVDELEFNPDQAEDAMTIDELREANGVEVTVNSDWEIGVVMKSLSNEFWRTLQEGYEQASADTGLAFNIQATTDESDEIGQQTMTETLTNQGVDALLLSPISDSNLTSAVENANDAGVLTVNVNDGLIAQAQHYVGPNAYMNGQLAAEWISEKLGDEGDVAIVIGMAKAFAARERTAGF